MPAPTVLTFLVPGDPHQLTGGYLYNLRIAGALRKSGLDARLEGLPGQFPETDQQANAAAEAALSALPDDSLVVMDGLALGGLAPQVLRQCDRLRLLALVHHPLCDETGLSESQAFALQESETKALARVRGVIATSAFTAARLADFAVPPERIRIAEPGTDAAPLAAGSGLPLRFLCVGGLLPRKGQDLLVRALAGLSGYPWQCDLVGSTARAPAFAGQVQELITKFELPDRVSIHGEQPVDNLAGFYHRADLFVLPSHYEGYGMVVTEALARGLAVIATTGGALSSTLPDGAGIKIPPGSVDALRTALRLVLSEPQQLANLRGGACAARDGLQNWDQAGERFRTAVDQLSALAPTNQRNT